MLFFLAAYTLTQAERTWVVEHPRAADAVVHEWTMSDGGVVTLTPSNDLQVHGKEVRAEELDASEKAYFLVIGDERIAVFAQMKKGRPEVWVNDATLDMGEVTVALVNRGDAHDEIAQLEVSVVDASGAVLFTARQTVGFVLAGKQRNVVVKGAPAAPGGKLKVRAVLLGEPLEASFSVP